MDSTIKCIDTAALQHNLAIVKKCAPGKKILAMIKADAYGHGLLTAAKAFDTADGFGVAILSEAIALRKAGVQKPIMAMRGFDEPHELDLILQHNITPVLHRQDQIDSLLARSLSKPMPIWLKIDTGMHRLGFHPSVIAEKYHQLLKSGHVSSIVLATHFASADDLDHSEITEQQSSLFFEATKNLKAEKSLANSAAILAHPNTHANWVRPGLMLYGVSPFSKNVDLKPAMSFESRVIALKKLQPGDAVGYGCAWTCARPTTIAVVGVGYGDGYPRYAKNGTPVLINSQRAPIAGRVSMDMITVDVTDLANVNVGDRVVLWSADLPVTEIAACANTISYTLLTGVMPRVPSLLI